jgi:hypothetical protein
MPIQINEPGGGNFPTVHVSGILSPADCEQFMPEFERLAMVGDMNWQHVMAIFGKPFAKSKIHTLITPTSPGRGSGWQSLKNL